MDTIMEILVGAVDGVGPMLAERLWKIHNFVTIDNYTPHLPTPLKKEFDAAIIKIRTAESDETQCREIASSLLKIYKRSVPLEQPN